MQIILAPMDGLTDVYAREILTSIGGYDLCITEFLRVTDTLFPDRVFYRHFPELKKELRPDHLSHQSDISCTKSNTPVYLQLLGSDPSCLSENAAKAVSLGAKGIDLNFGCPARVVNRRNSGASLLKYPEQIFNIVNAVRQAVPGHIPVTAKMRLGYDDQLLALTNAIAIQNAGASWVTIHARTRQDGYSPPAYWEALAPISNTLEIPVIANGEIWNVEDYFICRERSECKSVMLGRGAMVSPDLALQIKAAIAEHDYQILTWKPMTGNLEKLYQLMLAEPRLDNRYIAPRLKLWVKWLMPNYTQAEQIFDQLKIIKNPEKAIELIKTSALIEN
jgi:tRNA-dihydrouridine synthase C